MVKTTKHQLPKMWEPKRLTKTTVNKWRAVFNPRNPLKAERSKSKELNNERS